MAAGGHTGGHTVGHGYAVCQDTGTSLGPPQTFSTAEPKHVLHGTYHPHVSGGYVPRIPPHTPPRSPFSDSSSAWDMEGWAAKSVPNGRYG